MQEAHQGSPISLLIMLVVYSLLAIPSFKIARKAGFDWKMGVMLAFPGLNFITYIIFAFIKSPVEYITDPLKK